MENDSSGTPDISVLQSDKCLDQAINISASLYKVNAVFISSPSQHD